MTIDVKAVVFDFDMTLVDSSHAIHRCMNLMACRLGLHEVSYETVLAGIGIPLEESMRLYWGDFHPEWITTYRTEFRALERGAIKLFPNTEGTLAALRGAGVKCAVVSNRRYARSAIEAVGLAGYMDVVLGRENVTHPKPHPEALLKCMEMLCTPRDCTVYAGDTDIDMQTAAAAGVRGIGMATGNFDAQALGASGAWRVCADISEIPEVLGIRRG